MIDIQNISKAFKKKVVLQNINMTIGDGEVCGLMGVNGAGKSTLMKIICHLVKADDGIVKINGKIKHNNNGVGAMIENPSFYPAMTAYENLYALSILHENVSKADILSVLKIVGLEGVTQTYKQFSLGMKQRLYFAFAIMANPKILILDEPFNGIDPVSTVIMRNIIRNVASKGVSVLISGHSIELMKKVCDSIYLLDNSKIIYHNKEIKSIDLEEVILDKINTQGMVQ